MTPEEKAQQLINDFTNVIWQSGNTVSKPMIIDVCIFHVGEILELNTVWFDESASGEDDESDTIEYWQSVISILIDFNNQKKVNP